MPADPSLLGVALGLAIGFILGLLGGGGSILAVPILLLVFGLPAKVAIATSLVVVGIGAAVGFLTHLRQGTVDLRVALSFGVCAIGGAFVGARLARWVPSAVQLALFAAFAFTAAGLMLRDSMKTGGHPAAAPADDVTSAGARRTGVSWLFALQAVAVGVLTALIGAGGGFLIVPTLTLLAGVPVRQAVGSSLLVIAMNAASGLLGYLGQVPIDWRFALWLGASVAVGAVAGTRVVRHLPQRRIKQGFAVMILLVGTYLIVSRL